jgi:hypothetical protein
MGGGGIGHDLFGAIASNNVDLAQLAFRVSALEQMMSMQQQNNDVMLRLINALSSQPQQQQSTAQPPAACSESTAVFVMTAEAEVVPSAPLSDLAHNGVRRAAF